MKNFCMIKIAIIEINNDINLIFIIYFCNFGRYNFGHSKIGYIQRFNLTLAKIAIIAIT